MATDEITTLFFDFGGVITTSPFDAFAAYEAEVNAPEGTIRRINATNPNANAWARLERNELSPLEFGAAFEAEAAEVGYVLDGSRVLSMLSTALRPAMVEAIGRLGRAGYGLSCLTNNFAAGGHDAERAGVLELFDHVIESSVVGVRKPEPDFYRHALAAADVAPEQVVFLDDLGINLKPARQMGMTTIKVVTESQALADMDQLVTVDLSDLIADQR